MARPLRLEVPGGLYHVTHRGNHREHIYLGDEDRRLFLALLGQVCERFSWSVHAFCLMHNHYHLVLETRLANLSRGMRQLNGVYTQRFNRRHGRTGHVFEGRYQAKLVQKDRYLLAACRFVLLAPLRARAVHKPADWLWSSYRATLAADTLPGWLKCRELLHHFEQGDGTPAEKFVQYLQENLRQPDQMESADKSPYLGEEQLADRMKVTPLRARAREIPRRQRRPLAKELGHYRRVCATRDEAMARAYLSGVFTMREIGDYFGVHYMTVSRAVQSFESHRARQPAAQPQS